MIDEHFERDWSDGHISFSAGVDRAIDRIGRFLGLHSGENAIGGTYERRPSRTLFSGLAAVATTIALFVPVAALATPPAAGRAPAYVELASAIEHHGSVIA